MIARFDLDPTKKIRAYSKGNRQKVVLIAALMTRADLLVLDEPTSGLDPLMEQAFRRSIHEARERGQTVFLSSHIMSEVEALCDRVGILREGKLVEVGTLAEMRHLSALTIEATFDGAPPDLSSVPGVSSVETNGRLVRCHVRGSVEPLLKALAEVHVTELLSREPSLEELFLALYGDQAGGDQSRCPLIELTRAEPYGTIVTRSRDPGDCPKSGPFWGSVGLHLRHRHRLVSPELHEALQDAGGPGPSRRGVRLEQGDNRTLRARARLQTVAGFTAFKISMTLMILGAVWGLLTSTRLLRGEEDNGRWELLLAGQTTRRGAAAQALAGLGAGVVTLWTVAAMITVVTGLSSQVDIAAGPALYFALAMVSTALMFLAVGAVTSQLSATRRQAAASAAVILGVCYAVRMVADAGVGLHGLIWASPLGWVEQLQALTAPRPLALVPIVLLTAVLIATAVHLAGGRDVGASILPDRAGGRSHLRLLSNPIGLTARLVRPTVIGWWVAIALSAMLYGLVARSASASITGSSVHQVLSKLGARGTGTQAVLGVCFLVVAILVGFVAAGQITSARSEESEGHLDHLVVRPVSRSAWFGGRLVVATSVLVIGGLAAGVFAWLGTASQHSGVSLVTLLDAGVNLVPPAIAILGVGALTLGVWPRAASVVVYAVLGWSLLVVIVGGFGTAGHWILDTSVFHQMASAPAVPPDWKANGAMLAIGIVAALIGGLAFRLRDLQGE